MLKRETQGWREIERGKAERRKEEEVHVTNTGQRIRKRGKKVRGE